jgi:uroporphyrinogen decarboxylase
MFNRPYMGGLDKRGIVVSGSQSEIKRAIKNLLNIAPDRFILGASCTLPNDINWENIRTAISTAHEYKRI